MIDCQKSESYIKQHREETQEVLCNFAQTDLLLFWSDNSDVYFEQQKIWLPIMEQLQNECKIKLNVTTSLQIPNNEKYLIWLKNKLRSLSDKKLTAVFLVATKIKSVILGLLVLNKEMSVEDIFVAAFLEEIYQNRLWGNDEEALQKREQMKVELQEIKEYLCK